MRRWVGRVRGAEKEIRRSFGRLRGGETELQVPRLPPDFLSGLVASVNLVRLSLKKAAYVAVDWCSVVGNPEFAPPDFLSSLLALANLMRLSLLKAAHAVMDGATYRKSGSG
jgi:hypothetical protein